MGKPTHAKSINSNQQKNLETKSGVSLICRKYSQQDNIIKIKKNQKKKDQFYAQTIHLTTL